MVRNPTRLPILTDDALFARPRTVGDCRKGPRPCPFVGCRFNLLLDMLPDGSIVLNARYRSASTGAARLIPPGREADERAYDEIEDFVEAVFDEPSASVKSCVLDEAMSTLHDDAQLDEIAGVLFVSRERVRQIESAALEHLADGLREANIDEESLGMLEDILDRGGR
jgi:hypothetical protein